MTDSKNAGDLVKQFYGKPIKNPAIAVAKLKHFKEKKKKKKKCKKKKNNEV